jgi:hypothetical protein
MYRQRLYRFVLAQLLVAGLLIPTAVAIAAGPASGTVDSDLGLNFRAGPGLTYRVQLVLKDGQALDLLGRSANSQWLEARLPDSGLGGWVFAAYLDASGDLSALPVTEAAGGPTDERPPAAQAYPLYVSIVDNVATVYLQKHPANAEVVITLGRTGGSADLRVAQGTTDASGVGQINFAMPARWADGKAVVERNLVLVASTSDGASSHSANIVYIR